MAVELRFAKVGMISSCDLYAGLDDLHNGSEFVKYRPPNFCTETVEFLTMKWHEIRTSWGNLSPEMADTPPKGLL